MDREAGEEEVQIEMERERDRQSRERERGRVIYRTWRDQERKTEKDGKNEEEIGAQVWMSVHNEVEGEGEVLSEWGVS